MKKLWTRVTRTAEARWQGHDISILFTKNKRKAFTQNGDLRRNPYCSGHEQGGSNWAPFRTTRLAGFTHLSLNVIQSKHFLYHLIFTLSWCLKNKSNRYQKSLDRHTIPSDASSKSPFKPRIRSPETPFVSHLSTEDQCCRRRMVRRAARTIWDWCELSPLRRCPKAPQTRLQWKKVTPWEIAIQTSVRSAFSFRLRIQFKENILNLPSPHWIACQWSTREHPPLGKPMTLQIQHPKAPIARPLETDLPVNHWLVPLPK